MDASGTTFKTRIIGVNDEKQNAINEAIRLKDPNNWSDDEKENEADSPE